MPTLMEGGMDGLSGKDRGQMHGGPRCLDLPLVGFFNGWVFFVASPKKVGSDFLLIPQVRQF